MCFQCKKHHAATVPINPTVIFLSLSIILLFIIQTCNLCGTRESKVGQADPIQPFQLPKAAALALESWRQRAGAPAEARGYLTNCLSKSKPVIYLSRESQKSTRQIQSNLLSCRRQQHPHQNPWGNVPKPSEGKRILGLSIKEITDASQYLRFLIMQPDHLCTLFKRVKRGIDGYKLTFLSSNGKQ